MRSEISPRYQRVLDAVTPEPLSVTDIYRRWAHLPEWKALTRRYRNERRWLGQALENLADDGRIVREHNGTTYTFRTEPKQLKGGEKMPPGLQDKLEAMLVSLFETAADAGVSKDDLKKWIDSEVEVQLDQYEGM